VKHAYNRRPVVLGVALGLLLLATWMTLPSLASAGSTGKARLVNGLAVAPADAPPRVVRAIEAANRIAKGKGYCYGGGHRRWNSPCYDCSGAVSYALGKKGARLIKRPRPSGGFMRWRKRGTGRWITVYANRGHVYAVIAGLRFDTSMTPGAGPGWSAKMRDRRRYRVRHPKRL
jgi:hypothetical protein